MKEISKIRVKVFLLPLIILFVVIFSLLPLNYIGIFNFFKVMPLLIIISAFFLFVIGSVYDFGAKEHLKELMAGKGAITEADIRYINKQQLIMTLIIIFDGVIYILVGYLLSLL
jgi:type III secretory pathway component EscU